MNGPKEVGIRLKVAATGLEAIEQLGKTLRTVGVDTQRLDQAAADLSKELTATSGAADKLAEVQGQLAPVTEAAAKAAKDLAQAATEGGRGLQDMTAGSESAREKLGNMKLELAAAGAAAYTIGQALGGAAKEASSFETGMAEVATLLDDTSGLTAQADAVRALAREYGSNATDQAKALYKIISAGAKEGAEATGVLDQANKLALGGLTTITTAADGLTGVMNAYGKEAGTVAEVSDAFFVAMRSGQTTVGDLAASIGQVAPISSQAGVGLTELLSAASALTKGGTSTSEAMTQVRGIISAVIKPTSEAAGVAEELGIKFDAQALKAKGLAGFLADVRDKTGGNIETMGKLFGSVEALNGALTLTGSGANAFESILGAMGDRAGATDTAVAKVADTSAQAARKFQAALADVQISAGQALTALTPLLGYVTSAINLFNELPSGVKTTVAGLGALAIAAGPAALAVASVTKAVGLAVAALGAKTVVARALPAAMAPAVAATAAMAPAAAATVAPMAAATLGMRTLSGAATLLRGAMGVLAGPVGVVVGLVAALVPEFLRAKKAAEDGDEAVRKMLQGPPTNGVQAKAKDAVDEVEEITRAAKEAEQGLQQQTKATLDAAKALGVDLSAAAVGLTKDFEQQLKQLDKTVSGYGHLEKAGYDAGQVVVQAVQKMAAAAKNEAEFEALRLRIEELGKSGLVSEKQLASMLDTLKKKAREGKTEIVTVEDALKKLGLTSAAESKKLADDYGAAYELIKNDASVSIESQIKGFDKYRDAAIAANNGIEPSQVALDRRILETKANAVGMGAEFKRAMETTGESADRATGKVKALGDAATTAAGKAKAAEDAYIRLLQSDPGRLADGAGLGAIGKEGTIGSDAYAKARDARVDKDLPTIDSFGALIRGTPSGGITRTVGTGQATNKPPGEWFYTTDPYKFTVPGTDARGNRLPGGWAPVRGGAAPSVDPGMDAVRARTPATGSTAPATGATVPTPPSEYSPTGWVWREDLQLWVPGGAAPVQQTGGASAPAGGAGSNATQQAIDNLKTAVRAAGGNPMGDDIASLSRQLVEANQLSAARRGGSVADPAGGRQTIQPVQQFVNNVTIGGQQFKMVSTDRQSAEETIRGLEAAYRAGGG
jgi:TP901 family phage tail tape measure protein